MLSEVQPLRHASRQVVRELGLLAPTFGPIGISHSACHFLMEVELHAPVALTDLAAALRIDKSTASRMASQLQTRDFIRIQTDNRDRRRILISLTAEGRDAISKLHLVANRQVEDALNLLPSEDRQAIALGMQKYAQALGRARVARETTVRPIKPEDDAAVAHVIRHVMNSYELDCPGSALRDPDVSQMHDFYSRLRSAFFVADRSGKIVGGGGIAPLEGSDGTVCELRKMYFLPEARGFGLGQRVLEHCIAAARELGYKSCYLETRAEMVEAQRLYQRNGFQPCCPKGNTGHFICEKQFELEL